MHYRRLTSTSAKTTPSTNGLLGHSKAWVADNQETSSTSLLHSSGQVITKRGSLRLRMKETARRPKKLPEVSNAATKFETDGSSIGSGSFRPSLIEFRVLGHYKTLTVSENLPWRSYVCIQISNSGPRWAQPPSLSPRSLRSSS